MAAVLEAASVAARQSQGWQEASLAEALHGLLYNYGADEVAALEVVERTSTRFTLVGKVCWVDSQRSDLIEATFTLSESDGSISRAVIRAADRVATSDHARDSTDASARAWACRIASRPRRDEQWEIVIRYPAA